MKIDLGQPAERTQVVIAIELLGSINQAIGGMEQLSITRRDPRFLLMRDGLAALKSFCVSTLPRSIRVGERTKKTIIT